MSRSLAMLRSQVVIGILTIGNRSEKEAIDDGTLAVEIYWCSRRVAHGDVSESRAIRVDSYLTIFPGTSVPDYIYMAHADSQLHGDGVLSRYWLWSFAQGSLSPLAPQSSGKRSGSCQNDPLLLIKFMWKHSQKIDCPYDASEMEAWLSSPNHIAWLPIGNLGKSGPQTFPELYVLRWQAWISNVIQHENQPNLWQQFVGVVTIVRLSKRRHSVSEGMELVIYSSMCQEEDTNTFYFMNMNDTENKTLPKWNSVVS